MVSQSEFSVGNAPELAAGQSNDNHTSSSFSGSSETEGSSRSTPRGASAAAGIVAIIERRSLMRECLHKALSGATGWDVRTFATADDWLNDQDAGTVGLVILSLGGEALVSDASGLGKLARVAEQTPIAVMSDTEDPTQIIGAIERHVRGFIPTNLPLHVVVEALRLIRAGGTYIPASCLIAARQQAHAEPADLANKPMSMFTSRQLAVIAALRKGKANKIIAYELNMRESTVKVHVRNIMKKLKARNRTEVAYLANTMMSADQR